MKKYYLYGAAGSLAEVMEFPEEEYDRMIECVRQHHSRYEWLPIVYYGVKLEFEPEEIVKSWKIKSRR